MFGDSSVEQRTGPRYLVALPVRAEWDENASGKHVVAEGTTENIGPQGALVHLPQLPAVGSRVELMVLDKAGAEPRLQVPAEVLRLERNPAQPLAALQLIDATDEWRGLVWEPAKLLMNAPSPEDEDDFEH